MKDTYRTISKESEGFLKDRNSKFHAHAFPVRSVEDAKSKLELMRERYPDAKNHCFAWRIGLNGEEKRMNDAGEPANSAGPPIFAQIESYGLTNVVVIVVRYYGGVKLGVGGLIQAFRESTKDALEKARIVEKVVEDEFEINCAYDEVSAVNRIIRENQLTEIDQTFEIDCTFRIGIRRSKVDEIIGKFAPLNAEIKAV